MHDSTDARELEALWAQHAIESEPLIQDLKRVGYSEEDWENGVMPPSQAVVDVLLDHLQRPHPEHLLEWVARVLGQVRTEQVWIALAAALDAAPADRDFLRQGILSSMAVVARGEHLAQIRHYLADPSVGPGRTLLYSTLNRLRAPDRWSLIEAGLKDPDLRPEAQHLLHQRKVRDSKRPPKS